MMEWEAKRYKDEAEFYVLIQNIPQDKLGKQGTGKHVLYSTLFAFGKKKKKRGGIDTHATYMGTQMLSRRAPEKPGTGLDLGEKHTDTGNQG